MKVCPGFWSWLENNNQTEKVLSIDYIRDELSKGNDEFTDWAEDNKGFFLSCDDIDTQTRYAEVAAYASTLNMNAGALDEFLGIADSWLIAKALTLEDAVIVTHEKKDPNIKRKILIPNVCEHFGQKYINTFELLESCEAKFILAA
ncbi:protein of unknown function [Methylophaga sulfidovorans]|uniref:DUF4411 family protein n=1 Tax=Methylophaga sulfidovorans TaxID=45496 RepID=A0A1I3WE68_9GAMM|nr:protein of unknown function [Methylophaga sulfidovorans]